MARNTIIELTDDIDGTKGERTISFALDGTNYEIDLSKKNAAALEKALAPYVDAGRRVRGERRGGRSAGVSRRSRNSATAEIRAWAQAEGYELGAKGRIPASIVEAYEAAK